MLQMSVAGRLGVTAWRRRTTLLGAVAGVALVLLCLQYSALPARPAPSNSEQRPLLQRALHDYLRKPPTPLQASHGGEGVHFVPQFVHTEVTRPRGDLDPPPVVEQVDENHVRQVVQADSQSRDDVQRAMLQSRPQQIDQATLQQT
ncbi:hypothetical protein B566_EDAN017255 [Ephemera danica]|nr:hypothetical protein B566_EDAN017255 [Ephemera danica]